MSLNEAGGNGGGISVLGGTMTLLDTIVAGNTNTSPAVDDVSGGVVSLGHNLVGATDNSSGYVLSDLTGTAANPLNAGLGTLVNSGGPTLTLAPGLQSPALHAGDPAGAPATDQRGVARPQGSNSPNIGAFEGLGALVTNTNDSGAGSFRQGLIDALNFGGGLATIAFHLPGGPNTITCLSPLPPIADDTQILGPGAGVLTVHANGAAPAFKPIGSVTISGLRITNGSSVLGGGIFAPNGAGTITLVEDWFDQNTASRGGGAAYFKAGQTVLVDRCTFTNNTGRGSGDGGGAIYSDGSSVTVTNSTFNANTAAGSGAAIFVNPSANPLGQASLTNSTLSGNSAAISGGGLFGPNITFAKTIVSGNAAPAGPNGFGAFASGGYNAVGDHTGMVLTGGTFDMVNVNVALGPLQDNGGPTPTMALPMGSVAIDTGGATGAPAVDQRGILRPQGAAFDIGAEESPYSHCQ